jgi:DNA processing protein
VVVEARERSGALITADFALEEGREVFAVPGEITSCLSSGSNALLRLGATPLTRAEDVLESFGIIRAEQAPPQLQPVAAAVLDRIRERAVGADALARATGLGAGELAAILTELELAGAITQEEGLYRPAG